MTEEVVASEGASDQGEAPQLSAIEQKAIEQGWKPKDQFEGDVAEFIDAPEFVRRGELFGKIEHQGRELKAVRQALDALKQHNTKIEASAYDRALKELQSSRRQAIVEGETEKAFAIEDQIDDVKKERAQLERQANVPAVPEVDPAFTRWAEKNSWYMKDAAMQAVADRVGLSLARNGESQSEVLRKVEEEVRKAFPHKFVNTKREAPNAVEASSRGGSSVGRSNDAMDDTERSIMRKIVATGVMTEAEYKAQLKKAKE